MIFKFICVSKLPNTYGNILIKQKQKKRKNNSYKLNPVSQLWGNELDDIMEIFTGYRCNLSFLENRVYVKSLFHFENYPLSYVSLRYRYVTIQILTHKVGRLIVAIHETYDLIE